MHKLARAAGPLHRLPTIWNALTRYPCGSPPLHLCSLRHTLTLLLRTAIPPRSPGTPTPSLGFIFSIVFVPFQKAMHFSDLSCHLTLPPEC